MEVPQFIYSPMKNIWVVYSFGQLQIQLLKTLMYRVLCEQMSLIIQG